MRVPRHIVECVTDAKARIVAKWPNLAIPLGYLRLRYTPQVPLAGVTANWTLYVSDRFAKLSPIEQDFVLMHEIVHLLGRHAERREGRDPTVWNIAADVHVNHAVAAEEAFKDLMKAVRDEVSPLANLIWWFHDDFSSIDPKGTVEEIYRQLADDQPGFPGQGAPGDDAKDEGEGAGDSQAGQGQEGEPSGGESQPGGDQKQGDGGGKPRPGSGQEAGHDASGGGQHKEDKAGGGLPQVGPHVSGSASDGIPRPWEHQEELRDGECVPSVEDVLNEMRRRAQEARQRGTGTGLPGAIEEVLKGRPMVPWRSLLRRFLRREMDRGEAPSWRRPSRRSHLLPGDVFWPGKGRKKGGRVAVVIDTSLSIDDYELKAFAREIVGIARECNADVRAIMCSTVASDPFKVRTARDITGRQWDRGGTDLVPGMQKAAALRPDVVVVLTDGWTPWPDDMNVPVVVVTTDKPGPEWAKTVRIRPKQEE